MGISITNTIYLGKATPASAGGSHNLGWYATPEALQAAHPTGNDGDWAMVGSTDTVWTWDSDTSAWVDTGTTNAADRNLSNLTSTGKNIANWSLNISNCITEIPQDIKLELNNGTLTLKAGSKVYVPNGAGVYDVVTLTADMSKTYSTDGTYMLVLKSDGSDIEVIGVLNKIVSGATDSLAGITYHVWYDTTNNVINRYTNDGSTPAFTVSFPLCIFTVSDSVISSIDQVFNGAGYIGSEAFVLPGIKALVPEGFNSVGTLKSSVTTTSAVKIVHMNSNVRRVINLTSNNAYDGAYVEVDNYSDMDTSTAIPAYVRSMNMTFVQNTGVQSKLTPLLHFYRTTSNGVEQFDIAKPFHAVDYSDTGFIAHQAAPSSRYVNLAWPSSGDTIKAPADGYFTLLRLSGAIGEFACFSNASSGLTIGANAGGTGLNQRLTFPVSKDDIITIRYNLSGSATYLRFVYANGSK